MTGQVDDPEAQEPETRIDVADLRPLLPEDWAKSELFVVGYQAFGVPQRDLAQPLLLSLGDVLVILVFGSLTYRTVRSMRLSQSADANQFEARMDVGEPRDPPVGPHAVFFTAHDDEPAARQRITAAAGFLAAFQGKDIVYERLFELAEAPGKMSQYSPSIEMPGMHGTPNLAHTYLGFIASAHAALGRMEPATQNRINLALRWFDAAMRERGVDAFLKYWLAIETLAMPDGSNIRPIIETLASVYEVSYEEARERFLIGRLYGRRSRIVHQGEIDAVHADVLVYLFAVFIDLLRAELQIGPAHRIAKMTQEMSLERLAKLIG